MKKLTIILLIIAAISSCQNNEEEERNLTKPNWKSKKAIIPATDSLTYGKSYLPVYSHIYHIHEHRAYDLTVTVSIRNVSTKDTVYIQNADYYNTKGDQVRGYLKYPIYLKPMETVEIVIAEADQEGGSGANFIFEWVTCNSKNPPLFEAVMISTFGQQGLSFTTRGVQIHN